MNRIWKSAIVSSVLSWLMAAAGSSALGQQYPFLPVPGAPKGIRVLFQDSRGRLWMGGDQVACFDGTRFFLLSDYGLPKSEAYDITEDPSGAIWIGTANGVYRFSNAHVEQASKVIAISVIAASSGIAVAAAGPEGKGLPTDASLVRIQKSGNAWKTVTVLDLHCPGRLTIDRGGNLLYPWPDLHRGGGWNELPLGDVLHWLPGAHLSIKQHPVSDFGMPAIPVRILRDRSGCVWIGAGDSTYSCDDKTWHEAPFENARLGADLQEGADGSVLLAGLDMLAVGRPGSFRIAKLANGLPQLYSAIRAKDGTIWLGGAQGLYRFSSPFRMEYWTARDGVDNPWCIQRNGTKVYACLNRSIGVLSKDRLRWQSLASFENVGEVVSILPMQDGTLLAALNSGGTALINRNGVVLARSESPSYALRLSMTTDGEVWVGGLLLGRITRKGRHLSFENHHLETQPAGNVLDVQYEEHTRKLWACYNEGLVVRSQDGRWREITTKDGLLVNACWSLAALPNGDVWYGYYNTPAFGLVHPEADGRFTVRQFRAGDDIRDPESINFDLDQRGWLWRGGNHGLSVADRVEAQAGKWLFLDGSDGLSGEGVNSGSYFADSDGSVWIGIDISIFHYTPPADLVSPRFAPQIFVSAFSWGNQPPKLAEAVENLPHGSKVIAHIGSLQSDRRNALRLRYRILPAQLSWRESSSLDLPLGSLASGLHTLEVQGRVFTGPWSATVSRSIIVLTPAWASWPFLFSYALTAVALAGAALLLYRRHREETATVLPDLSSWRVGAFLPEVGEISGTVLDSRFEIGELLARGGFANVMDSYDRTRSQRCVVKLFRSEVKDKTWLQHRFEQEVAALQKIQQPNVVSIYAHGSTASGAPYLVMEFVEGKSLREILETGPLAPKRAGRILEQLAGALDAIHAQGVWHRDVKPENVILRNEGSFDEAAVLIDFSIAIVKDGNETLHGLSRAAGTFEYMAPEQAMGYAESSSDIHSLAKVVLEMLTGLRLAQLLPAASIDLPARTRDLLQTLDIRFSEESIEMLATALAFDPANRPHVAGAFAAPIVLDLKSDSQIRKGMAAVAPRGS